METLEDLLLYAETHGQMDEGDHEVGDLQDALRIAWDLLGQEGRETLLVRFMSEVVVR